MYFVLWLLFAFIQVHLTYHVLNLIIIQQVRSNLTKIRTYLLLILTPVSGIRLYGKLTVLRYKNHEWYLKLHAFYRDCSSCKNPDSVLKRNIPSHNTSSCYLYSSSKKKSFFLSVLHNPLSKTIVKQLRNIIKNKTYSDYQNMSPRRPAVFFFSMTCDDMKIFIKLSYGDDVWCCGNAIDMKCC